MYVRTVVIAAGVGVSTVVGLVALSTSRDRHTTSASETRHCALSGVAGVGALEVPLGASETVTLTTRSQCATKHLVLAWDGWDIQHTERRHLTVGTVTRDEVQPWLRAVDLSNLEIGLASGVPERVVAQITNDRDELLRSLWLHRPGPYQIGSFVQGITAGHGELLRVRSGSEPVDQTLVVMGLFPPREEQRTAPQAASRAKADGIEIIVVSMKGYGGDSLATSPEHFFKWTHGLGEDERDFADLRRATRLMVSALDGFIKPRAFTQITVTSTIPAALDYVPGSANPPADWDPAANTLSWMFPAPPLTTTVTYDVRALTCGVHPLPYQSFAEGMDSDGNQYRHDFESFDVNVPCATATPTVTPTSPTATSTPLPSPTSTPLPEPGRLFLPIALFEKPCIEVRRSAVALVIDTSASMEEFTVSGSTKLEAAVAAAGLFLELLRFPGEQAAIISFNQEATTTHELSSDVVSLRAALNRLVVGPGTNIAAGIRAAHAELASARRDATTFPVMVVLTDGRASVDEEMVLGAAEAAKDYGILVVAVGFGSAIERDQLRAIASSGDWYFEAVSADDLTNVYERIAISLPCPANQYWPRR